jgi:hypothetical protein
MSAFIRIIVAAFLFTAFGLQAADEEGWVSLFDGKTLEGWENPYKHGEVKIVDGTIQLTANKKFFLCTTKQYADFIFEAEIKLPEGKANSGIMFRAHKQPNKVFGYQAECDPTARAWSGGLYDEGRRGWLHPKKPNNSPSGDAFREKTKGSFTRHDFNKYRIHCVGNKIKIYVNDVLCTDFEDDKDAQGYFGLQHHGEKGATYTFRNIRVKVLKPAAE